MKPFPETLFIETTTRCNLSCPMCARSAPGWAGGCGDMDFALFQRLDQALAHARAVVLNGMGEPLLHPDLPRMIRFVKERQPEGGWCGLQTNALRPLPLVHGPAALPGQLRARLCAVAATLLQQCCNVSRGPLTAAGVSARVASVAPCADAETTQQRGAHGQAQGSVHLFKKRWT